MAKQENLKIRQPHTENSFDLMLRIFSDIDAFCGDMKGCMQIEEEVKSFWG